MKQIDTSEREIIKAEIGTYFYRVKRDKKLKQLREDLFYKLSGVSAIQYDKEKGNVNYHGVELKKYFYLEEIARIDRKILENEKLMRKIENSLKEIDKKSEKIEIRGENIYPSLIIIEVLCEIKTYKEASLEYGFKSTSSLANFINKNKKKKKKEKKKR